MIHLFTDFGWAGPYVGEMKAVLLRALPDWNVVDLMHDAPAFNPRAGAYLLAALSRQFRPKDMCLAVVDPGVGNDARRALVFEADGVQFVGPDNGLFALLAQRAERCRCREILWRPGEMSRSFHGRDWFAPVLTRLANGEDVASCDIALESLIGMNWPDQLAEVIYIDHFGNAVTGLRASHYSAQSIVSLAGLDIMHAQTFSDVEPGCPFWYENSMGLVEIAANSVNAATRLGLAIGTALECK